MVEGGAGQVDVIRASVLEGVPHGFLGRRGGVSGGTVAGLNTGPGSGDDPALIAENRVRAVEAVMPGARLVTPYQVHSDRCICVTEPWSEDSRPEADALVTDRPGLLLGVVTADCVPILLADPDAGAIGAAHAGWKGALAGICEAAVDAMVMLGARAERIRAAVGPCIAQSSYEVDETFRQRFLDADLRNERFFAPGRPGHSQFDLEAYVADRLVCSGLALVEKLGLDTYAAPERFFSYRRATHGGEPAYGRQISLIGLNSRP